MGVVHVELGEGFATTCVHEESSKEIQTQAPKETGGEGGAFSPTDLLAAALGSCVLTLMAMKARSLKISVKGAHVRVKKEMAKTPVRRLVKIDMEVWVPEDFSKEVQEDLILAAKRCPVHESLHPDIQTHFHFHFGSSVL